MRSLCLGVTGLLAGSFCLASPTSRASAQTATKALHGAEKVAQLPSPAEVTAGATQDAPTPIATRSGTVDGYRGIWFELGQRTKYGDKYSGGLGTYTANHVPMAVYAPQVNKTFFTYGGTTESDQRHLLIMISYYDHKLKRVPRPVIVMDKQGVDDPHDNAAINVDAEGYLWVFVSGRGQKRMGAKYRSRKPYDISAFDLISEEEMTYPQPHYQAGKGFFHLFTKYTGTGGGGRGRQLYWETSPNGKTWSEDKALSLMPGHYQVSSQRGDKIGSFFNVHPNADVDKRTNVYYAQTVDWGKTWTTVDGKPLSLPLTAIDNPALAIDYQKQNRLMYTNDLNWDKDGNPLLLYVTSKGAAPGPDGGPRELVLTRWTGTRWQTQKVAQVDHNYDDGSLWVEGKLWTVIAPTGAGPQKMQGGGEMVLWTSRNKGKSWKMTRQITRNSPSNHNYARRPRGAKDPFFTFWADGDPTKFSKSQLYFSDSKGHLFALPYDMKGEFATPLAVPVAPK